MVKLLKIFAHPKKIINSEDFGIYDIRRVCVAYAIWLAVLFLGYATYSVLYYNNLNYNRQALSHYSLRNIIIMAVIMWISVLLVTCMSTVYCFIIAKLSGAKSAKYKTCFRQILPVVIIGEVGSSLILLGIAHFFINTTLLTVIVKILISVWMASIGYLILTVRYKCDGKRAGVVLFGHLIVTALFILQNIAI